MSSLHLTLPGILLTFLTLSLLGCEKEDITGCMEPQAPNFDDSASESCDQCCEKYLDYVVTGTADTVDIIYKDTTGTKQKISHVNLDWEKRLEIRVGKEVYLEARSNVRNGSVRVKIKENNDVYKEAYSSDNYAEAQVSGKVPAYDN